jgi:hypothetical protein
VAGGDGSASTGGGGGAGGSQNANGGAGGSGLVILSIPDFYNATFSGGVTIEGGAPTTNGGRKIYVITAAGASDTVTFS